MNKTRNNLANTPAFPDCLLKQRLLNGNDLNSNTFFSYFHFILCNLIPILIWLYLKSKDYIAAEKALEYQNFPIDKQNEVFYRKITINQKPKWTERTPRRNWKLIIGNTAFDADQIARICKALGHPARIRILKYLKQIDRCICGDIVGSLPLAQSTVSQHLKVLKSAGLIQGEVNGPSTCYCINNQTLTDFKKLVETLWKDGTALHFNSDGAMTAGSTI